MSHNLIQEEQGQAPVEGSDATQCVTERSNDTESHKGGASLGDKEKEGRKADSVKSLENRKLY